MKRIQLRCFQTKLNQEMYTSDYLWQFAKTLGSSLLDMSAQMNVQELIPFYRPMVTGLSDSFWRQTLYFGH
jgi:hypothetical protein